MNTSKSNYEIYKHILDKETEAFNAYLDKLQAEKENKEIQIKEASMFVAFNLLLEISLIQLKINKLTYLSAEHFVYSSLEAFKNITDENPEMFQHNAETNVEFMDERLIDLFKIAYNNYMNSGMDSQDMRHYRSIVIDY